VAHRDDRRALIRLARDAGCEAGGLTTLDQSFRQHRVPGANRLGPHFVDDVLPAERRVDRGESGSPELEAARIRVISEFAGVEAKLVLGGEPACDPWLKGRDQVLPHVEIREPRASA